MRERALSETTSRELESKLRIVRERGRKQSREQSKKQFERGRAARSVEQEPANVDRIDVAFTSVGRAPS